MALIQILEKTISPGEQQFLSLRAWRFLLNVKRLIAYHDLEHNYE